MKYIFITLTWLALSVASHAQVLSGFEIDMYKFAVSENQDCSNPKVIIENQITPRRVNLVNDPYFGSGFIEPGTYNCVMLEISRRMYITPFNPPAGVGSCIDGNQSPIFIGFDGNNTDLAAFLAGLSSSDRTDFRNATESILIGDGISFTGSNTPILQASNSSRMVMYMTTNPAANSLEECFYISPEAGNPSCGIKIAQPLVISGDTSAKFITRIISPSTAIDNTVPGECNIQDIEFDFVQ